MFDLLSRMAAALSTGIRALRPAPLLTLLLLALAVPAQAQTAAGERVALVIGNGAYTQIPDLPNAVADARAIAATLATIGFEVHTAYDVPRGGLEEALRGFGTAARGADAALVFYAGHGVQVAGRNFLLPIGATADEPADLRYEAVALELVEAELADTGAAVRMVILDACRDNPLIELLAGSGGSFGAAAGAGAGVGRGLAPSRTSSGTLYAYATAPGEIALDGDGPHSPFTTALLNWLPTPGLEVGLMFRRVREEVVAATDGTQVPWVEEAIVGEFYFVPPEGSDGSGAGALADTVELAFWVSVAGSDNPEDLDAYLERYPDGAFVELALNRLDRLAETQAWPPLVNSDPAHLAAEVPVDLGRIRLTFDRPMATDGWSLVTAPDMPFPLRAADQGRWLDERTFEAPMGPLLPSTTYGFRINSATHHGFRIEESGAVWPETLVRFTTGSAPAAAGSAAALQDGAPATVDWQGLDDALGQIDGLPTSRGIGAAADPADLTRPDALVLALAAAEAAEAAAAQAAEQALQAAETGAARYAADGVRYRGALPSPGGRAVGVLAWLAAAIPASPDGAAWQAPPSDLAGLAETPGVRGSHYAGELRRWRPHGAGVLTLPDGTVLSGQWRSGQLHGFAVARSADGTVRRGEWRDGVFSGVGVLRPLQGPVEAGTWRDGRLAEAW